MSATTNSLSSDKLPNSTVMVGASHGAMVTERSLDTEVR
jgi:hypothetical protein